MSIDLEGVDQLSYEEAYAELERIVAALESNQQTLETSISLYDRGQALARRCADLLDRAELKIRKLAPPSSINLGDSSDNP